MKFPDSAEPKSQNQQMKFSPVLPTTGAFEFRNKIMLKCPNCGTKIKITLKQLYWYDINEILSCKNCGAKSMVHASFVQIVLMVFVLVVLFFSGMLLTYIIVYSLQETLLLSPESRVVSFVLTVVFYLILIMPLFAKFLQNIFSTLIEVDGNMDDFSGITKDTNNLKMPDEVQPGSPDNWNV